MYSQGLKLKKKIIVSHAHGLKIVCTWKGFFYFSCFKPNVLLHDRSGVEIYIQNKLTPIVTFEEYTGLKFYNFSS